SRSHLRKCALQYVQIGRGQMLETQRHLRNCKVLEQAPGGNGQDSPSGENKPILPRAVPDYAQAPSSGSDQPVYLFNGFRIAPPSGGGGGWWADGLHDALRAWAASRTPKLRLPTFEATPTRLLTKPTLSATT